MKSSATTPPAPDTTALSVENFGPIARATLDLRPFTVFVGPSNTGKSYLAILVYALHKVFGAGGFIRRFGAFTDRNRDGRGVSRASSELHEFLDAARGSDASNTGWMLPSPLAKRARSLLANADGLGDVFNDEIVRCFGADRPGGLIRWRSRRTFVSLSAGAFRHSLSMASDQTKSVSQVPDEAVFQVDRTVAERSRWYLGVWDDAVLADVALSATVGSTRLRAHYLPSDRAGVMHAHRVVVGSLIRRAVRGGIQAEAPLPQMSGVLGDFLEQLIELGESTRHRRSNALAHRLEDEILGGAVRIVPSQAGYPSFHYRPAGWEHDLPLMSTSSMVSELAPVVLYLRHIVNPGELLIIEEPEAHLHPAMQVELVKLLAAVVQAGIRVLITTHSEWVLEALANTVRLSEVPKRKRKQVADADVALSRSQVGAWLFREHKRPKGSIVEELPLDLDGGTFPAGYGEITANLYNRWASISNLVTNLQSALPAK